ncbi:hypothetical protein AAZX31_12G165900 [Glycine max]|uniref:Uncharacterized protein n=1 Tax=Glycine max TaxID=3847 RepID=A0A0R0H752_SOYBN|nr:hypothetical protein JHK85_034939 [Glycine max]KAG4986605.1 hypothetical protein JHK86_034296 [Glycine max]KAG5140797.1 hypothetical protein JHK84_034565 [Glycine max]KAH1143683.1 hypothetical protein GYH30_034089 [Glycine max]KAH1143684.1 hypothetical protein GYH30_034089 [Glycine max]
MERTRKGYFSKMSQFHCSSSHSREEVQRCGSHDFFKKFHALLRIQITHFPKSLCFFAPSSLFCGTKLAHKDSNNQLVNMNMRVSDILGLYNLQHMILCAFTGLLLII